MRIDGGWVLKIYPRSGLGFKLGLRLMNTVGIIDGDYYYSSNEGHIMIKLFNPSQSSVTLSAGSAFAQG
ncbi:MAG: deoxyuridine 5'-triphosphate nucleotidohydrolase, partial [Clostridia bacterium]|nr:deoxyuridine 5'-triphosphate nucleotidohydrolase [Clostridia bacterium]